ncbi:hypothetical protein P9112_010533 [Eukaryota sp. TZLM1-RC]
MSEEASTTQNTKPTSIVQSVRQNSKHPTAALFHVLFKAVAVVSWFLSPDSVVIWFAITITLLACDFWTVKNVTGRLLVGLRYWNKINEDGSSEWVFESLSDPSVISASDTRVFWTVLISYPFVWIGLILLRTLLFLGMDTYHMILAVVGIIFGMTNAIGYIKCRKDAKKRLAGYLASKAFTNAARV